MKLLFLFLIFSFATVAQTKNDFNKSIKKNGWVIPEIAKLNKLSESQPDINGFAATSREFDFADKKLNLELNKITVCEIRKGISYTFNEKNFAYEFQCVPFSKARYDRKTKSWSPSSYLGALAKFIFYDDDGDGKFETRYNSWKMPLYIPNWIKN